MLLCELKRYDQLDGAEQLDRAARQLQDYARSEDFAVPPPFLALYCGRLERTKFFRLNSFTDTTLLGEAEYEELGSEIWDWERVKALQADGFPCASSRRDGSSATRAARSSSRPFM